MKITHQPWSQPWLNPIFMQVKDSAWFLTCASPSETESCCSTGKQTRKTNQLEGSAWGWLDALWWCWWFMHGVCSLWEVESSHQHCVCVSTVTSYTVRPTGWQESSENSRERRIKKNTWHFPKTQTDWKLQLPMPLNSAKKHLCVNMLALRMELIFTFKAN